MQAKYSNFNPMKLDDVGIHKLQQNQDLNNLQLSPIRSKDPFVDDPHELKTLNVFNIFKPAMEDKSVKNQPSKYPWNPFDYQSPQHDLKPEVKAYQIPSHLTEQARMNVHEPNHNNVQADYHLVESKEQEIRHLHKRLKSQEDHFNDLLAKMKEESKQLFVDIVLDIKSNFDRLS
jgi:hypothetical protein